MNNTENKENTNKKSFLRRAFQPLSHLWQLRSLTRRYRRHLIILGILGVVLSAQALIAPQITRAIIDKAYPHRDFTFFYILSAIMVGINVISAAVESVSTYLSTYVYNLIAFRVRMRVFRSLHRLPVSYVESHQSGMFLERIASDADRTAEMLSRIIPEILALFLTIIITLVMMLSISPLVTGLVLAIVPLYYFISSILAMKLRVWQQHMRRKDDQLTTMAMETIQGVPTARLFGVGKWLKTIYTGLLRDKIKMAFGMWRSQLIYGRLSWAATYFWGVVLTVGGWYLVFIDRLTLGEAVALGMYIPMLLKPAEQALGLYQALIASSVPAQRVNEVLDNARKVKAPGKGNGFQISNGVRLQKVKFAYPDSDWCLKDISLEIKPGQTTVVIGPTGSGKTTLLRLLAGMYDKYDGQILADEVPLSRLRLSDYQSNVAMVMADNFFFSGTIMENMCIAGPNVNEEEVRRTAQILGIDKWLNKLQNGYFTRLGVDGIRLSSGQIQKIAILRALLKKPRLLLLDEITSAMDVESERYILDGLNKLRSRRHMTVMTTHRLTLTAEPWINHVVVLDDGFLKEQGKPHELYLQGGEYRKLMNMAGLSKLVGKKPTPAEERPEAEITKR